MPLCNELMQFLPLPPNKEIAPAILSRKTFYKFPGPYPLLDENAFVPSLPWIDSFVRPLPIKSHSAKEILPSATHWRDL